jgi:FlgN protein
MTMLARERQPVVGVTLPAVSLPADVLAHLAAQIGSAERLLEIVLEQGKAIRGRDVHGVVRLAGLLHGEISRREELDRERSELLSRCGARLGVSAEAVTVTGLAALMDRGDAEQAHARSAQLRGLLAELQREHVLNRALMKVELSFLDHLMRTLALDGAPAYDASGLESSPPAGAVSGGLRVLDLEA